MSYVKWRLDDGSELVARILRISQLSLACAVLDRELALRTSEILTELQVVLDEKPAYTGRALVSSMVDTGTQILCELSLDPPGLETATDEEAGRSGQQVMAYESFLRCRQEEYRIRPEFKLAVVDVESLLVETRRWMERVVAKSGPGSELALVEAIAPRVIAGFNARHEAWEELAGQIEPAAREIHQEFVRHHWQPLFLCSPFAWRTCRKPLGYAGDYEMMNMIHRHGAEGDTAYAQLIHLLLVSQWPAQSVRNRIAHLREQIISETARAMRSGRRAEIMNIGCGPAWEVQDLIRNSPIANHANFTLVDFNQETLDHAQERLNALRKATGSQVWFKCQRMSVQQLLTQAQKGKATNLPQFDMVYCAGLFDYLSEPTCKALVRLFWNWLSPGGVAVVANMDDAKPFRNFIEFVLEWHLIYRKARDLLAFCSPELTEGARTVAELTSVNVFLHLRKPG